MTRRGDIGRQQASYRRGLVLGLTVAESMLLILFALLLALGWVLVKRDHEAASLRTEIMHLQEQSQVLEAKVDVLDALARNQPTDKFFKELAQARADEEANRAQQAKLEERARRLDRLDRVMAEVERAPDKRERLGQLAALGEHLEKALDSEKDAYDYVPEGVELARAAAEAKRAPGETRAMLKDAARGALETSTLRGQVTRLQKELRSVGKGGEYPPCWVTEAGDIEYLFDITLNSDRSLTLRDVTPPLRLDERRALPIPPQLAGTVGKDRFMQLSGPLLAWENAKGCRLFVIARDRTGPTQKDLFKELLIHTVEARFYKSIRQ